jgi:hypothetical protein
MAADNALDKLKEQLAEMMTQLDWLKRELQKQEQEQPQVTVEDYYAQQFYEYQENIKKQD